jgi:hypothetical protein
MPKQQCSEACTGNALKSKTTVMRIRKCAKIEDHRGTNVGLTSTGPLIVESEGEVVTDVM